ncbi:hypothetical protein HK097_008172 [Rhizophlyctis rosea]|uniref:Uncharacterized protein n=1 Tax=Rhizophlyctis rosea TaxID=64517 RepID=A0AAD5X4Q2_9FUNG|nr:hypothetical protein HK097_008172 [Rhizophlyctis rosea]
MLNILKSITSRKSKKSLKSKKSTDLSKLVDAAPITTDDSSKSALANITVISADGTPVIAQPVVVKPFSRKAKERALSGIIEEKVVAHTVTNAEKADLGIAGKRNKQHSRDSSRHSVAITPAQVPKPWMNDPPAGSLPRTPRMRRPVSWAADLHKAGDMVRGKTQPSAQWAGHLPTPVSQLPPRMPSPPKSLNDSDRADSAVSMESPPSTPMEERNPFPQSPAASKRSGSTDRTANDEDQESDSERDEEVPLFLVQQALAGQYNVGRQRPSIAHGSLPRQKSESTLQRLSMTSPSKLRANANGVPTVGPQAIIAAPPNTPYTYTYQQQQPYPSIDQQQPTPYQTRRTSRQPHPHTARPDSRRNTTDFSQLYTYKQPQLIPTKQQLQKDTPTHTFTGQLRPRERVPPHKQGPMIIPKTATANLVAKQRESGIGMKSGPGGMWTRDERGMYSTVGYAGAYGGGAHPMHQQHHAPGMPVGWM